MQDLSSEHKKTPPKNYQKTPRNYHLIEFPLINNGNYPSEEEKYL